MTVTYFTHFVICIVQATVRQQKNQAVTSSCIVMLRWLRHVWLGATALCHNKACIAPKNIASLVKKWLLK